MDKNQKKKQKRMIQTFVDDVYEEDTYDRLKREYNENPMNEHIAASLMSYLKYQETKEIEQKTANLLLLTTRLNGFVDKQNYFMDLSLTEQNKYLTLAEGLTDGLTSKPLKLTILDNTNLPTHVKQLLLRHITLLEYEDPYSRSNHKIKEWIETCMLIPFQTYIPPPSISSIKQAEILLNNHIYGIDYVKNFLLQIIAQWINNPLAKIAPFALWGPPGTAKTTILQLLSKILNRPLIMISLGGACGSNLLLGHSYTYEGSRCGEIVNGIIRVKCMNPIIYFDELDKVSTTPQGDEIIHTLIHLIDHTQNTTFYDRYLSNDIPIDVSKCLFIFSYNHDTHINPILKDRIRRIEIKPYSTNDKLNIATHFLIPEIQNNLNFSINIPNTCITHIIQQHTQQEPGVRTLKRHLETIHLQANLLNLTSPNSMPTNITNQWIDSTLQTNPTNETWQYMYN